jgi:hypothetical protein
MRTLDAGPVLEQLAGEMRHRADPGRALAHCAGMGLGVRNQIVKLLERRAVRHNDDIRVGADE